MWWDASLRQAVTTRHSPAMQRVRAKRGSMASNPESRDSGSGATAPSRNDAKASLRKPVRPALLHAALERRPPMHALQPLGEIRIRRNPVEHFRQLRHKTHLDIRPRQRIAHEELAPLERPVDIAEMPRHLAVDPRMQRLFGRT